MRPPHEIWLDEDALADHFDAVKANLKAGRTGGGGDDEWESIPSAGSQNELTKNLRKG